MKLTWPVVALIGVLLAAAVSIMVFVPPDHPQANPVLIAITAALSVLLASTYLNGDKDTRNKDRDNIDQSSSSSEDDAG